MVRTLLSCAFGLLGIAAVAQCQPDMSHQNAGFGAWPDTTENFLPASVGVFYSDTMHILLPQDAGDILPTLAGITLDSVSVIGVSGLPTGIAMHCNSQTAGSCTYLAGVVGCGTLQGTPTVPGTYPLTINVVGYTNLLGQAISYPYSFSGYRIVVSSSTDVQETSTTGPMAARNVPNPFSERTWIEFSLPKASGVRVQVYNLVGEKLWDQRADGRVGKNRVAFDGSRLGSGIYLYKVLADGHTVTGRMVLDR